jgi:hypothetical protein
VTGPTGDDRLREISEAAARGFFPTPGWTLEVVGCPQRLAGAVLAFTGFHIVAAGVDEGEIRKHLDHDDIAAPFNPVFLAWLGRRVNGRVGHIDLTMARWGTGGGDDFLVPVPVPPDNERVRRARWLRSEVRFLMPDDGSAVVAFGAGLGGRQELSMEITEESARSQGLGTRVVRAALAHVRTDVALFATVAPGNTRSLRCLLACGFSPIGAECLISTDGAQ